MGQDEPDKQRSTSPCSSPHSAPIACLKYDPGIETPADPPAEEPTAADALPLAPPDLEAVAAHLRGNPAALAEFVADLAPEGTRRDGWTPFARKLFLQVLADTGRVGLALEYTGLSKQSANALRQRDPLFAAGWDAAALMARDVLADDIVEKGLGGITETVTRGGEVVATRHRYDARLSMAALHRLDKRCDRAEEQGSAHLAVMRRWDEYLDCIGKGDEAAARALVESPPHGQFGQLPESANPIPPGCDSWDNFWRAGSAEDPRPRRAHRLAEGAWMTTFPPPPAFDGYENTPWDGDAWYERACTAEEAELIEAHGAATQAAEQAELTAYAEAERDTFFAKLRAELAAAELGSAAIGTTQDKS